MAKFKPVVVRPTDGGALMTALSSEVPGVVNYTVKREFRRVLDREVRCEGHDYFQPNTLLERDPQCFPDADSGEDFLLIITLAQASGRHATIGATRTRIYRYTGTEDPWVEEGYFEDGEDSWTETNQGGWLMIGSGFSENGQRWEAAVINGELILNNTVDLPVRYGLADTEVTPLYELRELGIASVGTIGEVDGILVCGNLKIIQTDKLEELLTPVGGTYDLVDGAFYGANGDGATDFTVVPGYTYHWKPGSENDTSCKNGTQTLTAEGDFVAQGTSVTLLGTDLTTITAELLAPITASQTGVETSGNVWGRVPESSGPWTIETNAAFDFSSYLDREIWFQNGARYSLFQYDPSLILHSTGPGPYANKVQPYQPFYFPAVVPENDFLVNSNQAIFTADMVGCRIRWENGEVREILEYKSPTQVRVDNWTHVDSGVITIENPKAYAAFTDTAYIEHYQYRITWSLPNQPTRFGSIGAGSVESGSRYLQFKYPLKSLSTGDEITIVGAGVGGGNLTATILYLDRGGYRATLDTKASTTVEEAGVQRSDIPGSITAKFEDLEDDGSAIVRMLNLQGYLIIYKETVIYVVNYTADTSTPFDFAEVYRGGRSLRHKFTLISVMDQYHIYAGVNAFYRFDMTNRTPMEMPLFQWCQNIFFEGMYSPNANALVSFAGINELTQEIWFCFDIRNGATDRVLRYDFKNNSISTSLLHITCCASIKRPSSSANYGLAEDWFVMGGYGEGSLLRYGLVIDQEVISGSTRATMTLQEDGSYLVTCGPSGVFEPHFVGRSIRFANGVIGGLTEYIDDKNMVAVADVEVSPSQTFKIIPAIWHRNGASYDSTLQGGLDSFGRPDVEKQINSYTVAVSSRSEDTPVAFSLLGCANPGNETVIGSKTITHPRTSNQLFIGAIRNYFADRLVVSGKNNPIEITSRTFSVAGLGSEGQSRMT